MIRMFTALALSVGGLLAATLWLDPGAAGPTKPTATEVARVPEVPKELHAAVDAIAQLVASSVELPSASVEVPSTSVEGPSRQEVREIIVYEPTGRHAPPPHFLPDRDEATLSGDRAGEPVPEEVARAKPSVEAEVWTFAEDGAVGRTTPSTPSAEPAGDSSKEVSLDDRSRLIRRLLDVYARIEARP